MDYVISLLIMVCIYVVLTATLDLLIGYAGILTFGHAAFVGIGAYASALLATKLGLGFVPALAIAFVLTAAAAWLVALPTLRLSGDYFLLASFAFAMVVSSLLENWVGLTNGPYGIYGIPHAGLAGHDVVTTPGYFAFAAIVTAILLYAKRRLVTSPLGITLRAIREDATVAAVLGKDVFRVRLAIFTIACAVTAIAGTLLAFYLRFIDPTLFTFQLTVFLWAALFVGGCSSTLGNVLGPAILVLFPEALRFVGLTGSSVPHVQQALYGLLLIVLTLIRPQGISGTYRVR